MNNAKDFDFMFTPEFCYCLGFLWGDGHLSSGTGYQYNIAFEIVKEDFDEIIPIFQKLDSWNIYSRKREGRRETGCARLGRKVLYDWLKQYNYKSKNSDALIISIIPENLKGYWLRGLIDADGCFSFKKQSIGENYYSCKLAIYGPINQDWTSIGKIFTSIGVDYKIIKRTRESGSGSELKITKRQDLIKVNDLIYNEFSFGLKRKRVILQKMLDYDLKMKDKKIQENLLKAGQPE